MPFWVQIILQLGALGILALVLYFGGTWLRDHLDQITTTFQEETKAQRMAFAREQNEARETFKSEMKETRHAFASSLQARDSRDGVRDKEMIEMLLKERNNP